MISFEKALKQIDDVFDFAPETERVKIRGKNAMNLFQIPRLISSYSYPYGFGPSVTWERIAIVVTSAFCYRPFGIHSGRSATNKRRVAPSRLGGCEDLFGKAAPIHVHGEKR